MAQTESSKRPVAVLGATGVVGQRLIHLLATHPWFEVAEIVSSDRSAGREYRDAARWCLPYAIPESVAGMKVLPPSARLSSGLVFSALDAETARELEPACALAGHTVVSNAGAHRMDEDVPLLIPEVNPDHIRLIERQRERRNWQGFIVTNPNCTAIGLTMALAPIHAIAKIDRVVVSTLQAVSGAGYPGVASLDVADNVVPGLDGEEAKIESEPRKLLGLRGDGRIQPEEIVISAHTHRVGVTDGHLMSVSFSTREAISLAEVSDCLTGFRGLPQLKALPSAPRQPIVVVPGSSRPQPRLDRMLGNGMTTAVGRLAACPVLGTRMEVLSHNTVRGAAGGTLLIAEMLLEEGWLS